jgi:hypothetical protein
MLQVSNNNSIVDTIVNSVNITNYIYYTTINFNFQQYYFKLIDPSNNTVTSNVTLTIGNAVVSLNNASGYFYYGAAVSNNT